VAVALNLEVATVNEPLVLLARQVCDALVGTATELVAQAGLPDMSVHLRLTDEFVAEIESQRNPELPSFTTKRVGGDTVARARQAEVVGEPYAILIDASAFASGDAWALSFVPQVLAHELAHCLLGQCRLVYGVPTGYSECPSNPVQVLGYTSLTVCDEYVADRLGEILLPPVAVDVEHEGSVVPATDRVVIGTTRLTSVLDELDAVVYPRLPKLVVEYRQTGEGLNGLVDELTRSLQEVLVMYAHYKAAVRALPEAEPISTEIHKVSNHPGTGLLLDPFWHAVAPRLEHRCRVSPLVDFAEQDQLCLTAAIRGLELAWAALGIEFELLPDDAVFVHVSDPVEVN
jgi:hypothetical protein